MNTNQILLAALLMSAGAAALPAFAGHAHRGAPMFIVLADDAGAGGAATASGHEKVRMHMAGAPAMGGSGKLVKNAPYAAEALSERQHSLVDGNEIARSVKSMSYRDSAGNTRHEIGDGKGEVRTVVIRNVAEGVTYILHPQDKTATRLPARERAARMQQRELARHEHAGEGRHVVMHRAEPGDAVPHPGPGREARALRGRAGAARAGAFAERKWADSAVTKELGTREIDGVKAEGKLRSYEIPAGEIGNRNAIVITDETWFSPELQLTVYSKHTDPRSGTRVHRLASLKRDEPAASLFAVPSDYTVTDAMTKVRRVIDRKAP